MNPPTQQPIRLETDRFILRPLDRADVTGRLVRWLHDDELLRYVELPAHPSTNDFLRFMRQFDNVTNFLLGIFEKSDERLLGFYQVHTEPQLGRASTEVMIGDRRHWGTNAVFETRTRLLDYLFDTLGLYRVYGTVHARNLPALFNYKALGFTCEGILRGHAVTTDDEHADVYFFGMLRDEWLGRGAADGTEKTGIAAPGEQENANSSRPA